MRRRYFGRQRGRCVRAGDAFRIDLANAGALAVGNSINRPRMIGE
jgi:hypothetical protein